MTGDDPIRAAVTPDVGDWCDDYCSDFSAALNAILDLCADETSVEPHEIRRAIVTTLGVGA